MKAQLLVGKNLRRLRVARAISQENLAVDAGVDRTYISRLERLLENPTVAVLERLANALGCEIVDFFDVGSVSRAIIKPLRPGRKRL